MEVFLPNAALFGSSHQKNGETNLRAFIVNTVELAHKKGLPHGSAQTKAPGFQEVKTGCKLVTSGSKANWKQLCFELLKNERSFELIECILAVNSPGEDTDAIEHINRLKDQSFLANSKRTVKAACYGWMALKMIMVLILSLTTKKNRCLGSGC